MDYQQALEYVLSFADYERCPGAGYAERWDLRRMNELLERLGFPHLHRKTIHIAGSKGKGSTAAMIASVLRSSGFCTGLYTSPHLHTMRERIKVDDELITEQEFSSIVAQIMPMIEAQNQGHFGELSTFEILTALAFVYFRNRAADMQVLETGLGGRLDATNVVPKPDVCVITSISLDHTAVLGNSLAEIAAEKAGIIKADTTVVVSPQEPDALQTIRDIAGKQGARLVLVGKDISWKKFASNLDSQSLTVNGLNASYELTIPLIGDHQLENAATAVGALEVLGIDPPNIASGMSNVRWSGRLEILRKHPLVVADGAHNGDSARRLVKSLRDHFKFDRSILVLGTSADKNSTAIIAEFAPFFDCVIITASNHPRATEPGKLMAEFGRHGVQAQVTNDVSEALRKALGQAGSDDLICATGSLFLVAEVIEELKGITGERYPEV